MTRSSSASTIERRIHCPRCEKLMEVDRPHRGLVFAYRVWIVLVGICAVFAPLFIADLVLMLPLMSGVALAGPTLARLADEPIRCRWCRLALRGAGEPAWLLVRSREVAQGAVVRALALRLSERARAS
jgi:hypothetical protein